MSPFPVLIKGSLLFLAPAWDVTSMFASLYHSFHRTAPFSMVPTCLPSLFQSLCFSPLLKLEHLLHGKKSSVLPVCNSCDLPRPSPAEWPSFSHAEMQTRPFFFFSSPLQDMVFLHSHCCPGTLFVDKAGLEIREIHLSYVLGCMCYHAWQRGVLLSL